MGRKSTPLTILNNEGTSELFFEIAKSDKDLTPKMIKKNVNLANSSISEQLKRLYDAKIIDFKNDNLDNRNKYYFVDWDNFTKVILDYYVEKESDLMHSIKCSITKPKYSKEEGVRILTNLKTNEKFVKLIENYFVRFTDTVNSANRITETLASFEEDLLRSDCTLNGDLLKWRQIIQAHYNVRKNIFEESIRNS